MFTAIGIAIVVLLWMTKDILRKWSTQKESNLDIGFAEEDYKNSKKITKLYSDMTEYIEENGDMKTIKDVRKLLKGNSPKATTGTN